MRQKLIDGEQDKIRASDLQPLSSKYVPVNFSSAYLPTDLFSNVHHGVTWATVQNVADEIVWTTTISISANCRRLLGLRLVMKND